MRALGTGPLRRALAAAIGLAAVVVVGVLASFASLNYLFTAPRGEFGIGKGDDLVALLALGITTGVLGITVARVNRLRLRSDLRE